jgi:hypothetical protein
MGDLGGAEYADLSAVGERKLPNPQRELGD